MDDTDGPCAPVLLPQVAIVPPSLIADLDTWVEDDFGPGRLTLATLSEVPGAGGFTDEIQLAVDADIDLFEPDTVPADALPFPELLATRFRDLGRPRSG